MTSGFFSGDVFRGLAVRVLFFLSLALLPIGLFAINQTQQLAEQNRISAELSLLAITQQASLSETEILQNAIGASRALAAIVKQHKHDTAACRAFFKAYLEERDVYSMVGYIPADGRMVCSSTDREADFSADPMFELAVANPRQRIQSIPNGRVSNQDVTTVTTPVFEGERLEGFVFLSIPSQKFNSIEEAQLPLNPVSLFFLNNEGEVIGHEASLAKEQTELPTDVSLALFLDETPEVFQAENENGLTRVYAVRPLIANAVYAVSIWPTDTTFLKPSILTRLTTLLPIVMWAASLIVAFWALNRLAIRHIRKLGRQMRRFAINRHLPSASLGVGVPSEIIDIEEAFISMGESILRDEATLEDSLRQKNILLKEVHHRVKNNLQLISSIMNLQIRQTESADSRRVMQRLQERILGLATVHKNLYQNDTLVRVNASDLLHEVVNQLLSVGLDPGSNVEVSQNYDEVSLEADDAAPLTLLVSEAITNALKHIDQSGTVPGRLSVDLVSQATDLALLTIKNTKGTVRDDMGTGLGSTLINAFARQLNGDVVIEDSATEYTLSISFPVPQTDKPQHDY